jgi:Methyltransferase domain
MAVDTISNELRSFQDIWAGGYFEGNPADPLALSTYGLNGYISSLHALYLGWIRPFMNSETVVLEIGPGRGAWTKAMLDLGARHIYALDALSAEHNGFWQYVGSSEKVTYDQVSDCSLGIVPDLSVDYFFTFGCLCHVSPKTIEAYVHNLYGKMKPGSHGLMMVADYNKNNTLIENRESLSVLRSLKRRRFAPFYWLIRLYGIFINLHADKVMNLAEDTEARPHRWYHCGVQNACKYLEASGFKILDADIGVVLRDPVIHFTKE